MAPPVKALPTAKSGKSGKAGKAPPPGCERPSQASEAGYRGKPPPKPPPDEVVRKAPPEWASRRTPKAAPSEGGTELHSEAPRPGSGGPPPPTKAPPDAGNSGGPPYKALPEGSIRSPAKTRPKPPPKPPPPKASAQGSSYLPQPKPPPPKASAQESSYHEPPEPSPARAVKGYVKAPPTVTSSSDIGSQRSDGGGAKVHGGSPRAYGHAPGSPGMANGSSGNGPMPTPPPKAMWRLPPKQRVLQVGETDFDLRAVARQLTVVISTSVGDFTPSTTPVMAVLEGLQANLGFHWCRKVLVFDAVPTPAEMLQMRSDANTFRDIVRGGKWIRMWNDKRCAYKEYCETLRSMKQANHPALFNVELVFLEEFGHLLGTVRSALALVTTPYVFITQHDLSLAARFVAADVQRVLDALKSGVANYILLNRDVNSSARTSAYLDFHKENSVGGDAPIHEDSSSIVLTAISGFSDQAHFARTDWYRTEVLDGIAELLDGREQRTCMEHVLHEPWKKRGCTGTFLFGASSDGPFVFDCVHGMQVLDRHGRMTGLPSMPSRRVE